MEAYEIKNVFVTSNVLSVTNANTYTVYLPNFIKDVHRVEVSYAAYYSSATTTAVYLDIEELRSPVYTITASANTLSSISTSAFAVLPAGSGRTLFNSNSNYPIAIDYPYPIQKLDRLTIKWTDQSGILIPMSGETAFLLRVFTLRKNMLAF
jgi:hypothetical protein